MSVTLVLPDPIAASLCRDAQLADESAGVLLARSHRAANGDMRLLGACCKSVTAGVKAPKLTPN